MTTAYTSLLGLALPVTGELSGTWGDTVNNSITSLLDSAVAGTTNVSTDADVTLTTTTGAANTAREAILLFSGARTALRTVTAPAQSKVYTVINATTGGYSVQLVGSGPTTGVTILAGESAVCAWNGSDFVKVSNAGGSSSFVNLTVSGNLTLSGGTANGVPYLNGSKVLTSGSALTFDGAKLGVGNTNPATAIEVSGDITIRKDGGVFYFRNTGATAYPAYIQATDSTSFVLSSNQNIPMLFKIADSEQMRLTSTGLGIGTTSPAAKLDVNGSAYIRAGNALRLYRPDNATYGDISHGASGIGLVYNDANGDSHVWQLGGTTAMLLNTSGNLGLGVTPSAWFTSYGTKVFQFAASGSLYGLDVSSSDRRVVLQNNAYIIAAGGENYLNTGAATKFLQTAGQHQWFNAPSGTAGNAITFTQAMTLDASGKLGIGYTSNYGVLNLKSSGATYGMEFDTDSGGANILVYARTGGPYGVLKQRASSFTWSPNDSDKMFLDSSGNLGLGVTPSAWASGWKALQLANGSSFVNNGATNYTGIFQNAYYNGTNTLYLSSTYALKYELVNGTHAWYTSGAGTAGNAITFTQAMTLDASGNLGVGSTTPSSTGIDTGVTKIFAAAPNSNFGPAITTLSDSLGRNMRFANQAKNVLGALNADNSGVSFGTNSSHALAILTNGAQRALIDIYGNLGLGITPNTAWSSTPSMQFGGSGTGNSTNPFIASTDSQTLQIGSNTYWNGSVWKAAYASAITAMRQDISYNEIGWNYAPGVTGGTTQSFVRAMTLDNSGNLILPLGNVLGKSDNTGAVAIYGGGVYNQGAGVLVSGKSNTNPNLVLFTREGYVESARIDSSGNLLVGTTSVVPDAGVSILNPAYTSSPKIYIGHTSGTASGNQYEVYYYAGTAIGSITQNGTTGVLYNLTSDYRLKNNPVALTGSGKFIDALQPKTWDWHDGSGKGVGFIAHEFMEVAKYSGNGKKDDVDADGKPIYQSIQPSSSEVMAYLVAEIQSLRKRLADAGI